ncbi:MAG: hypothetical protein ABIQ18_21865 [Umezawaea sp.]
MITSDLRGAALVTALLDLDPAPAVDFLSGASARTWLALDEAARYSSWHRPAWADVLARRMATTGVGPLERVLSACGRSGWVREAEVGAIARHGESPQVLALRSADWVEPVRARARRACEPLLAGPSVVELAPVAFALRERQLGGWLVERVEAALRDAEPAVLATALRAPDVRVRRFAYDVALTRGSLDLDGLLRGALRDADLPIRRRCVEAATRVADADDLRVLLTCRAAAVRAEAVRALGSHEHAVTALTDRSPLVRSIARRLVPDAADRYRALLPNPNALAGLGETGDDTDAELVRPWLADPHARVRAAAVNALRRLRAVDVAVFEEMLTDPSGAVTRSLVAALRAHSGELDRDRLLVLLLEGGTPNVRVAAHRLLRDHSAWTRLLAALRLVAEDAERRPAAIEDLRAWLLVEGPTAYTAPNPGELRQALCAAERHLDRGLLRQVAFVIG